MNLIAFTPEQAKEVLDLIGVDTSRECVGKCESCKRDIFLKNIGNIAKKSGKNLLYCEDPDCFSTKIAEQYNKLDAKGEKVE